MSITVKVYIRTGTSEGLYPAGYDGIVKNKTVMVIADIFVVLLFCFVLMMMMMMMMMMMK